MRVCVCVCVCVCVYTHTHACTCMWVVKEWERQWESSPSGHLAAAVVKIRIVWCLLTWSMIHNWGRTAVAGCTDRSQGGWPMIGPSGAKLSISPNVHCPLSAPPSSMSLPGICKPRGHRPETCLTSVNMMSSCRITDCTSHWGGTPVRSDVHWIKIKLCCTYCSVRFCIALSDTGGYFFGDFLTMNAFALMKKEVIECLLHICHMFIKCN